MYLCFVCIKKLMEKNCVPPLYIGNILMIPQTTNLIKYQTSLSKKVCMQFFITILKTLSCHVFLLYEQWTYTHVYQNGYMLKAMFFLSLFFPVWWIGLGESSSSQISLVTLFQIYIFYIYAVYTLYILFRLHVLFYFHSLIKISKNLKSTEHSSCCCYCKCTALLHFLINKLLSL